jgi:hypothetical protein
MTMSVPSLPGEQWKPVQGFEEFYEVSNLGRVKRLAGLRATGYYPERLLKPQRSGDQGQYKKVMLSDGGQNTRQQFFIHRLVAFAFCDGAGPTVNHKNGDTADNRAANLEWFTHSQNQEHALALGLSKSRKVVGNPIGHEHLRAEFRSAWQAAVAFGDYNSGARIQACAQGKRPHALGWQWSYT